MQQGLELYYNGHYDMAKHEYLTVITLLPDFSMDMHDWALFIINWVI